MKCPKCGYVSHDYLSACRKCSVDLLGFKAQMQLHAVQAGNIDLRRVLGGVQSSPTSSGEFDMGEALFDSPMLVAAQTGDGFDINLDDDFSFTPSGMSLESLDGFESPNAEAMSAAQRRSADTGRPKMEAPETGYATVMMDISNLHDDSPTLEPTSDQTDAPIKSAEDVMQRPDLSTEGHGTDDLNHESGELILPSFDADALAIAATDADTSSSGSALDAREASFTMPELPDPGADEKPVNLFTEEISFAIDPLAVPELPPMEFPSLQTRIGPAPEPEEAALMDEASSPELVQPATEDGVTRSPHTRNTTMDLDISDVQLPETLDEVSVFPDLPEQTDVLLAPSPDEATIVDVPSPLLPTHRAPADLSITLPEAAQAQIDETDDALDMELLFPDEQPPKKRD